MTTTTPDILQADVEAMISKKPDGSDARVYASSVIPVSFLAALPTYPAAIHNLAIADRTTFMALSSDEIAIVKATLKSIERVAGVTFVFPDAPVPGGIRIGLADLARNNAGINVRSYAVGETQAYNDVYVAARCRARGCLNSHQGSSLCMASTWPDSAEA